MYMYAHTHIHMCIYIYIYIHIYIYIYIYTTGMKLEPSGYIYSPRSLFTNICCVVALLTIIDMQC